MPTPLQDLEAKLAANSEQILVLAGAGVACASTRSTCASWIGLLKNGLERCHQRCHGKPREWFSNTCNLIDERTTEGLIQAASRIVQALRDVHAGEYGAWLAESIGALRLDDRRTIDAILSWRARIATTNYDNLFEDASELRAVVWSQGALALRVLRGDEPGILHLHGHYLTPETVVLGATSYEDICRDMRAQNFLRAVFTLQTIVFVGCGSGVDDPNFSGLLDWSKEALRNCQHSHYHLVRESELEQVAIQYQGIPVTPISYGRHYDELAPFLEGMAKRARRQSYTPLPIEVLTSTQTDYELGRRELEGEMNLPAAVFIRRNFELAQRLWNAGGRRTAALHMDSTLNARGNELTNGERLDFTLEAVEHLLDDSLDFHASVLMKEAEKLVSRVPTDVETLTLYRRLLARCLTANADLDKLFQTIDARLPNALGDEKGRLSAEKAELLLISGDLERAENDAGVRGDDGQH